MFEFYGTALEYQYRPSCTNTQFCESQVWVGSKYQYLDNLVAIVPLLYIPLLKANSPPTLISLSHSLRFSQESEKSLVFSFVGSPWFISLEAWRRLRAPNLNSRKETTTTSTRIFSYLEEWWVGVLGFLFLQIFFQMGDLAVLTWLELFL